MIINTAKYKIIIQMFNALFILKMGNNGALSYDIINVVARNK